MTLVMATGVFDILHPGHIHFLSEARKLGDRLVVVVARDRTAMKNGKMPLFDENTRLMMVSQLKLVDQAVLGHIGDIYETVSDIKPDIIALGYDQHFNEQDIEKKCLGLGLKVKVMRMSRSNHSGPVSSSEIKKKVIEEIEGRT